MVSTPESADLIPLPRPVLRVVAAAYAFLCLSFCLLWLYAAYSEPGLPAVELGFDFDFNPRGFLLVTSVYPASPAEAAGLAPGDRIVSFYGHEISRADYLIEVWRQHKPGDTISLGVRRPSRSSELVLDGVFRKRQSPSNETGFEYFSIQVRNLFPVPFVLIGLVILFLRIESLSVWLLTLILCSTAATPDFPNRDLIPLFLRPLLLTFRVMSVSLLGPLYYFFFAVFPVRSPIDWRFPQLKWGSIILGVTVFISGEHYGDLTYFSPLQRVLGNSIGGHVTFLYIVGFIVLGWVSLVLNYRRTSSSEARRKIRVIFWGTLVGWAPTIVRVVAENFLGFRTPVWLGTPVALILLLFPLSFAYAVVRHRILEIPVLLKRSARYLLVQRGFTIVLFLVSIGLTFLLALSVSNQLQPATQIAQPVGFILGACCGGVLLLGGTRVHRRVSGRIDRAFFRSAYDARMILEDLAERTSSATDRFELARLLERHLTQALRPRSLTLYLQEKDLLVVSAGTVPPEWKSISGNLPQLVELTERGEPWEVPAMNDEGTSESSVLKFLHAECLVPLIGRGGTLVGVLVLGSRLSEEPYSREDKRLLASVGRQAATALDNIRLAGEIADRLEAERRTSIELEIARNVQDRLLPTAPTHLRTLDCAARCIQAKSIGGDYYDFLDLGGGRLGLVLADVSGKGIHAALLMANLQAQIRSQSVSSPGHPAQTLKEVNQMLWKSTASEHFATLFYGIYDDYSRSLTYVNCGHNPPVVIRHGTIVRRLKATATLIGAFEKWRCTVRRCRFVPGDLLVMFSDGITEAVHNGEQFGEEKLINLLLANGAQPVEGIAGTVLSSVQEFSAGSQTDDLTLLIARVRGRYQVKRKGRIRSSRGTSKSRTERRVRKGVN